MSFEFGFYGLLELPPEYLLIAEGLVADPIKLWMLGSSQPMPSNGAGITDANGFGPKLALLIRTVQHGSLRENQGPTEDSVRLTENGPIEPMLVPAKNFVITRNAQAV